MRAFIVLYFVHEDGARHLMFSARLRCVRTVYSHKKTLVLVVGVFLYLKQQHVRCFFAEGVLLVRSVERLSLINIVEKGYLLELRLPHGTDNKKSDTSNHTYEN